MDTKDKLIEKYEEYITTANKLMGNWESSHIKLVQLRSEISALKNEIQKESVNIVTVTERVVEIFNSPFCGHPSREDDHHNKSAIIFLAEQIDVLHKLRIKNK